MPRILLLLTVLSTALVIAACGNEGESSSGATSLAPAGSLVYGEATLSPEGDQRAAIDELISKFPGEGSAGDRIQTMLQKAFSESESGLSYQDDIEPWLGDEASFFVSRLAPDGSGGEGALLVATEDEEASVAAIEKAGDSRKSEHNGHDLYLAKDSHGAAAVLEGWVVVGTPRAVKTAIDTAEGGEAIEGDERYEETLADAPEERLGFVYVNMPALYKGLKAQPGFTVIPGPLQRVFDQPLLVTANADEAGVRFESTVPAALTAGLPVVAEGSGAAGELPGDSWLAFAQPELGKTLETTLDTAAAGVAVRDALKQQLRAMTGLDLDRDVISWMGDWSAFVRGESVAELNGAVVIETTDEAASGRFIDALARLARSEGGPALQVGPLQLPGGGEGVTVRSSDVPEPIHLFQRDGKVVAAYGDAAARDALDPAETLADSPDFAQAEQALGGDYAVSFFLAIPPLLELAEAEGAGAEEDFQQAKPYLEPLGALVGGARKDGDKLHSAFGLSVR
jgi:Protein of unknown function (DUF3352)